MFQSRSPLWRLFRVAGWLFIAVYVLWTVLPILIMFLSSFKNLLDAFRLPAVGDWTGLAKLVIGESGPLECRFCPAWIDEDSSPHMLSSKDPRFAAVTEFLIKSTREAGLATRFEVRDDELIVSADR